MIAALTALERKNSGVNGVDPEKQKRYRHGTGIIPALTPLNREKSGVNGVGTE